MRNKSEGKKLMVLKLNMEKAYDMMRWDFIEMAMSKFGFDMKFIDMVMGCISKPSFATLVNGTPTTWFESSLGLKQVDPLSPYLSFFVLKF